MDAKKPSKAVLIGLGVVIVAEAVYAVITRQWWLLAVAAGLSAVFFSQLRRGSDR